MRSLHRAGRTNGLSIDTIKKRKLLEAEFKVFFGDIQLRAITLDDVARFRESWKMSAITARKKIERLRSFFKFCVDRDWIEKNPAAGLKLPKETVVRVSRTSRAELEKIESGDSPSLPREFTVKGIATGITAFVAGAAVDRASAAGTSVQLKWSRMDAEFIVPEHQKNGKPVKLPLHKDIISSLEKIPQTGNMLFWSGEGNAKSAVGDWANRTAPPAW